jgi:hypothetical protein
MYEQSQIEEIKGEEQTNEFTILSNSNDEESKHSV